jgi:hypothetical protein
VSDTPSVPVMVFVGAKRAGIREFLRVPNVGEKIHLDDAVDFVVVEVFHNAAKTSPHRAALKCVPSDDDRGGTSLAEAIVRGEYTQASAKPGTCRFRQDSHPQYARGSSAASDDRRGGVQMSGAVKMKWFSQPRHNNRCREANGRECHRSWRGAPNPV